MKQSDNLEYWNKRAMENDGDLITHRDLFQKKLELDLIAPHLKPNMHLLEVGCGNGYITEFLSEKVAQIDAFDISDEMIKRAKQRLSSKNNCRFFIGGLPEPSLNELEPQYDAALSVRVLINLPNREAQSKAIDWIASKLKQGGKLLLLEGSQDGLEALNNIRSAAGLSLLKAPSFNKNINRAWLEDTVCRNFKITSKSSIGMYDYLTRFFYPLLVGENNVQYNTDFHKAALEASKITPDDENMFQFSRLHIYILEKR